MAQNADLIICILDSSRNLEKEDIDILQFAKNKKTIIVLNKTDLDKKIDETDENISTFKNIIKMSAIKNDGIEDLYDKISKLFNLNEINFDNEVIITNERHKNLIQMAIKSLDEAKNTLKSGLPIDFVEISLKNALSNLGEITGEEAREEIINEIFSRFCLGK